MLRHGDKMMESMRDTDSPFVPNLGADVVMGHEFCAEIVEFGPNTLKRIPVGSRVVSMPISFRGGRPQAVGYSDEVPGGYGELMVLTEPLLLEVPNGLATEYAATTEPIAVGVHAVAKANVTPRDAALVVGCGPVGLAVIAALRLAGVETIVAADYSPMRRARAAHGCAASSSIRTRSARPSTPIASWPTCARRCSSSAWACPVCSTR
jgi:threonine dehydrogenase-like Zn-dependent dehydrogenase